MSDEVIEREIEFSSEKMATNNIGGLNGYMQDDLSGKENRKN